MEFIKILGDWYSDAVLLYLTVPSTFRLKTVTLFAKVIISHPPHNFHSTLWVLSVSFYFDVLLGEVFTLTDI